eukprot:4874352-Pleurochrysis_carterae.AAC.1
MTKHFLSAYPFGLNYHTTWRAVDCVFQFCLPSSMHMIFDAGREPHREGCEQGAASKSASSAERGRAHVRIHLAIAF